MLQAYILYGLSPVIVVASVVPLTANLTGVTSDAVVQYAVYAVMMPFFGMGGDQRADSWLGEPGTVDTEKLSGDDGTAN